MILHNQEVVCEGCSWEANRVGQETSWVSNQVSERDQVSFTNVSNKNAEVDTEVKFIIWLVNELSVDPNPEHLLVRNSLAVRIDEVGVANLCITALLNSESIRRG